MDNWPKSQGAESSNITRKGVLGHITKVNIVRVKINAATIFACPTSPSTLLRPRPTRRGTRGAPAPGAGRGARRRHLPSSSSRCVCCRSRFCSRSMRSMLLLTFFASRSASRSSARSCSGRRRRSFFGAALGRVHAELPPAPRGSGVGTASPPTAAGARAGVGAGAGPGRTSSAGASEAARETSSGSPKSSGRRL